jgi:hypothetical protein
MGGVRIGDKERNLLGRGDQDVRRLLTLADALGVRRVSGAGLDGEM